MFPAASNFRHTVLALLLCLTLFNAPLLAQNQTTPAPPDSAQDRDEVIRISTEIVQTDVMVFDKSGKFVAGLKPEDFELRVEGKPQKIEFFEFIRAGTMDEDAQLRAARGGGSATLRAAADAGATSVRPLDRGRAVFFFVDDLHLAPTNLPRVRSTLKRFIDEELGQNDEAAITSASGQIGFLQQLTGEKAVLHAAVERLTNRSPMQVDMERPIMTEAHASAIDRNRPDVIEWFVQMMVSANPGMQPEIARQLAQQRARNILSYSTHVTRQTLDSLESLVRSSSALPGRKVLFFLSDGFYINRDSSDTQQRLRRITDSAARAGVVIYAMDVRGLVPGMTDVSMTANPDPGGLQPGLDSEQLSFTQEPLRTLSADTGGRALLNTNALGRAVSKTLADTSVYYLLAWRPEASGRSEKFRQIQVSVRNRPELKVSVRRGFYLTPPPPVEADSKKGKESKESKSLKPAEESRPKTPEANLVAALVAPYPRQALPISLALGYVNSPNNSMTLTASIEFDTNQLAFSGEGTSKKAVAEVVGAIYDERGKVLMGTKDQLVFPAEVQARRLRAVQNYQYTIAPGLHQVRFAARDKESGRIGSVTQWVEIPDPKKKGFYLSSLFVGERTPVPGATREEEEAAARRGIALAADRRFSRASWLRFITYIYNAVHTQAATPDVVLQVQVLRDDQPVMTTPLKKVQLNGVEDMARVPYAAEVPLETLPAGRYVLLVTAIDRNAKASASQRINFMVE